MGWDCMVALMKCQQAFGKNQKAIANVITTYQAGVAATSCNATMTVLGTVMCPGRNPVPHSVTSKAEFVPKQAIDHMERLVDGDEAIFVSIWPDHHFTVLPLDANKVA